MPCMLSWVRGLKPGTVEVRQMRPLSTHSIWERTTKGFPFGFSLTTTPSDLRNRFCAAEDFNGSQISAISASMRNIGAVIALS